MDVILQRLLRRWGKVWGFAVVFVMVLGVLMALLLGRSAQEAVLDRSILRHEAMTKSGAESIETFLNLVGNSASVQAHSISFHAPAGTQQMEIDRFIRSWEGTPVVEMVVINPEGIVTHIANREGSAFTPGVSAADREYFIEGSKLKRGQVWIGEPIMPRLGLFQGEYLIPIASPMHDMEEKFWGVLTVAVRLSDLTKEYLDPLRIYGDSEVYLVRSDGLLYFAPKVEMIGKNLFELIEEKNFAGASFINTMVKGKLDGLESGVADVIIPDAGQSNLRRKLVAYNPVNISSEGTLCGCMLAVVVPREEILSFVGPFYVRALMVMAVAFLGLLVFAIRIAKIVGYEEGMQYTKYIKKK